MSEFNKEIYTSELKEGMLIVALDRPWHETPFPIQGFYIKTNKDIEKISKYCKKVYVDKTTYLLSQNKVEELEQDRLKVPQIEISSTYSYKTNHTDDEFKNELENAKVIVSDIHDNVKNVIKSMNYLDQNNNEVIEDSVSRMTESIINNHQALLFVCQMKNNDNEAYNHSLKVTLWAMSLARSYNLPPKSIQNIGKAALLCKIGRSKALEEIKNKSYSSNERDIDIYKRYPLIGSDMIKSALMNKNIILGVRFHRERHNGSGFPFGLTGEKIPLISKLIGISDFYEYLIKKGDNKRKISPSEAISILYKNSDILFQEDLVDKFIKTIGIYPVGSSVILSNGEFAIVKKFNSDSKLRPLVSVLLDRNGKPKDKITDIDLSKQSNDQERNIFIKKSIPSISNSDQGRVLDHIESSID